MEVNANAELKSQGLPAVPTMEREQRQAAETRPVAPSGDAAKSSLDDRRQQEKRLNQEHVDEVVREIQERLDAMSTKLQFSKDDETEEIIVQVTSKDSGEIIRQIPSEEIMELKAKLDDLIGILFDQKV